MGSGGISHTISKSKKRTYYLCESEWNIKKLNKYRKKQNRKVNTKSKRKVVSFIGIQIVPRYQCTSEFTEGSI